MKNPTLLLFILSSLLILATQAAPVRPNIPEVFESFFVFQFDQQENDVHLEGHGTTVWDQPKGKALEHLEFPRNPEYDSFVLLRYDLGTIYDIRHRVCQKIPVNETMPSTWGWIANANFTGTRNFRGRLLDVWELTIGYATTGVAVGSDDPNVPVFSWRYSPQVNITAEYRDFRSVVPNPDFFIVPRLCNASKININLNDVGCLARTTIMARAAVWVDDHVPYNQGATHDGYREDCSGYVSYCWETSKPGYVTSTLPQICHWITKTELMPGDVLLDVSEHVVLFGGWANAAHTEYVAYEETRPGEGTVKRVTPYPYWYNTASFRPCRYNSVC